jgi:hypothetical protein
MPLSVKELITATSTSSTTPTNNVVLTNQSQTNLALLYEFTSNNCIVIVDGACECECAKPVPPKGRANTRSDRLPKNSIAAKNIECANAVLILVNGTVSRRPLCPP